MEELQSWNVRESVYNGDTAHVRCVELHLRHERTEEQTDRRQESNLMQFFSLKMWHLAAIF